MIGVLMKKQFAQFVVRLLGTGKNGKKRSPMGMVGFALLLVFCIASIAFAFVGISTLFADIMLPSMGWIYFILLGGIAFILGVFGTAISTFSALYQAKDNELLLSMPIPSGAILLSRMLSVYLLGLLYESIVLVPGILVYIITMNELGAGPVNVLFPILMWLAMSFIILAFSCFMGWIVALVASRIKNKTPITVVMTILLLGVIYYFQFNSNKLLNQLAAAGQMIGEKVRGSFYPLYAYGAGSTGDVVPMLAFIGIAVVLCAVTYLILSRSFRKIATRNVGFKKAVYKEKTVKQGNVASALLSKEFKHYLASPAYILNSGLSTIIMTLGAIVLIVLQKDVREALNALNATDLPFDLADMKMILLAGGVCLVASMNSLTAPAISLEGKTFWLLKSLPIQPMTVLQAKMKLHLLLTVIPALLLLIVGGVLLEVPVYGVIVIAVLVTLYITMHAQIGLLSNLRFPNMNWTNETVATKSGMPVFIALFGGWTISFAMIGLYFLVGGFLSALSYFALMAFVLAVIIYLLNRTLLKKGTKRFMEID